MVHPIPAAGVSEVARVGVPSDTLFRSAVSSEAAYDHALVHRFRAGDESAFNEIVECYREKMLAIALRVLRNQADAEEIAQRKDAEEALRKSERHHAALLAQ